MSRPISEKMAEKFIDETKDAEQIAMEMQTAYLAGEEDGELTTAYKDKGRAIPKEKTKASREKDLAKPRAKDTTKDLERNDTNPDQENCPWKMDEGSCKNRRRKRNVKLVDRLATGPEIISAPRRTLQHIL